MNKKQLPLNWIFVMPREAVWAPLGVICFYAIGLALICMIYSRRWISRVIF